MTPNHNDSNQSRIDSTEQSPAADRMLSNQDPGVSRRDFLGMTAASLILAGGLAGAAKPEGENGIPHRTLGRTGEKVSADRTRRVSLGQAERSRRKHSHYSYGNR